MGEGVTGDFLPEVEVKAVNLFLADVVKWFHFSIAFYTLVGWALPWEEAWWVMLFLVPAMKIHWMTNNNICFLTTLEQRLRGNPHAGTAEQGGFLHRIAVFLLRERAPSKEVVNTSAEIGMYVSWLVSVLRLFVL